MKLTFISEGLRILSRRIKVGYNGINEYEGYAEDICKSIIHECYDKRKHYFRTSCGHFKEFYCRDFGWVCENLIALGYENEVSSTLKYALHKFSRNEHVTVAISPSGVCFDFPNYAVDSLPYILYCLAALKDHKLVSEYREFIEKEINFFIETVLDKKTGLVKPEKTFSSMKDHSIRISSCYDLCMLFLLQKSCASLSIKSGLEDYDYLYIIMNKYWTGTHFLDDLSGSKYVASDANLFPFWVGLVEDREIFEKAFNSIITHRLDQPIPLKYTAKNAAVKFNIFDMFATDYELDTCWTHMGILFVGLIKDLDETRFKYYLDIYTRTIEKNGNYLEVFRDDMEPYKTLLYFADEGMIWCANYLFLRQSIQKRKI